MKQERHLIVCTVCLKFLMENASDEFSLIHYDFNVILPGYSSPCRGRDP